MKKLALAMLILALAMPAMANVEITLTSPPDSNIVTIGYNNTGGEMVRAFGLEITVSGGVYIVGSDVPDANDYYVYPSNMTFTVVDGNTVIDQLGSPIAEADENGGVLEMASLYAANDPCHPTQPLPSGVLVSFAVDCGATVSLALNGKRGNVVLEDPDVIPAVDLPDDLVVGCDEEICWDCPGQPSGDATGDGRANVFDLIKLKQAWGTQQGDAAYNCCADFTQDTRCDVFDLIRLKQNWGASGLGTCTTLDCP